MSIKIHLKFLFNTFRKLTSYGLQLYKQENMCTKKTVVPRLLA